MLRMRNYTIDGARCAVGDRRKIKDAFGRQSARSVLNIALPDAPGRQMTEDRKSTLRNQAISDRLNEMNRKSKERRDAEIAAMMARQ